MNDVPSRRWFRFRLRTILIVITVLCVWLAWQVSIVRERRVTLERLRTNSAFQIVKVSERRNGPVGPSERLAKVSLVRRLLGDEPIQQILYTPYDTGFQQTRLAELKRVFPEATVKEAVPILYEPCHPGCFPRGTLVETPTGTRAIDSIQPGQLVLKFDAHGHSVSALVDSVFETTNRLWHVETEAGSLLTTETQPLCLASGSTVPAGQLRAGDPVLWHQDRQFRAVQVLQVRATSQVTSVFNLVLEDGERFVAGGFLVRSKPPRLETRRRTRIRQIPVSSSY